MIVFTLNIKLSKMRAKKLTIEEMQSIAQQRKGKCLSKKYIDSKSKLRWQCEDGHIWEATVSTVMGGAWCPECAGNKKLDMPSMNRIANERGGFNGSPFKLVVRTTEGPWGAGSKESVGLVYEDEVRAIVGSLDGRNAHLAEQVVAKSHLVYMETKATDPTLSQAYVPWFLLKQFN